MGPDQHYAVAFCLAVTAWQDADHVVAIRRPAAKLEARLLQERGLEAELPEPMNDAVANKLFLFLVIVRSGPKKELGEHVQYWLPLAPWRLGFVTRAARHQMGAELDETL